MQLDLISRISIAGLAIFQFLVETQRLLLPSISLFVDVIIPQPAADILAWGVIFVLFLLSGPVVYQSNRFTETHSEAAITGLWLLFAITGVAFGIGYRWLLSTESGSQFREQLILLVLASTVVLVFITYLLITSEKAWFGAQGTLKTLAVQLPPADQPDWFEFSENNPTIDDGIQDEWRRYELALSVGVLFAFPVVLAGLLTDTLFRSFPVPDLLLILWVLAKPTERVTNNSNLGSKIAADVPDIATQLVTGLSNALRSLKGAVLVPLLFTVAGGYGAAVWHALSLVRLHRNAEFTAWMRTLPFDGVVVYWGILGSIVLLVLASGYGFWVVIQELRHLDTFLDYQDAHGLLDRWKPSIGNLFASDRLTSEMDNQVPSLPFHILIPNVLLSSVGTFWTVAIPTIGYSFTAVPNGGQTVIYLVWSVFGVVWPTLAVSTCLLIVSFRNPSRHQTTTLLLLGAPFLLISVFVSGVGVAILFVAYSVLIGRYSDRVAAIRSRWEDLLIFGTVFLTIGAYTTIPGIPIDGQTFSSLMILAILLALYPDLGRVFKRRLTAIWGVRVRSILALCVGVAIILLELPVLIQLLLGLSGIEILGLGPWQSSSEANVA